MKTLAANALVYTGYIAHTILTRVVPFESKLTYVPESSSSS